MITVEPFHLAETGRSDDPVLAGVSRGLAQTLAPVDAGDLPPDLAALVRLLQERDASRES